MFYRKLISMGFLAFCASLYFNAVQVEGFRLDEAKGEVSEFLRYFLEQLGNVNADLSDINDAQNVDQLTTAANGHLNDTVLSELERVLNNQEDKRTELSENYIEYENNFHQLLNGDYRTMNKAIPMARTLAPSLYINRQVFNLAAAKQQITSLLQYLHNLLLFGEEDYSAIINADNLEELTNVANNFISDDEIGDLMGIATGEDGDVETPQHMRNTFRNYRAAMRRLINEDSVTRGSPMPMIDVIRHISGVWNQQ